MSTDYKLHACSIIDFVPLESSFSNGKKYFKLGFLRDESHTNKLESVGVGRCVCFLGIVSKSDSCCGRGILVRRGTNLHAGPGLGRLDV